MLSKKIEFNFPNFLKKKEKENKKNKTEDLADRQNKISGFAIGFFINLALGALLLSIGLVIL